MDFDEWFVKGLSSRGIRMNKIDDEALMGALNDLYVIGQELDNARKNFKEMFGLEPFVDFDELKKLKTINKKRSNKKRRRFKNKKCR